MSNNSLEKLICFGNKSKLSLIFLILFVVTISFIIYGLNELYPIYIDDWDYSFVYYTNDNLETFFESL